MKHLALDLYGTLIIPDTSPLLLSTFPGISPELASSASNLWRALQLQYTWRLTISNSYLPFQVVTELSLSNALTDSSIPFTDSDITSITTAYPTALQPRPDTAAFMAQLATRSPETVTARLLSNGDYAMLKSAMAAAEPLGEAMDRGVLKEPVSVEGLGRYKPAPEAYQYFLDTVGIKAEDAVLVSSNTFDIVGASGCGFETVYVDREGKGWGDGLGVPSKTVRSLDEVLGVLGL